MKQTKSILQIAFGALIVALALEGFLVPNHFIDGGITGVSMLFSDWLKIPLAIPLVIVNLPFVLLAKKQIGLEFAIKSGIAICAVALMIEFVHFPMVTNDKLLGAVFGGFFMGAGVGLAIRGGSVLDGTEVLALVLSRRTFATMGEIILVLNAVIFSLAAVQLGVEPALYSGLTYFTASKTIDYLLHGIEAFNGVMVVSQQNEAIRQTILRELGRGVTAFKARGGFSEAEQEVLFCVVTRLEITKLETLVKNIDESAFIVVSPVLDTSGGVVKRRTFH